MLDTIVAWEIPSRWKIVLKDFSEHEKLNSILPTLINSTSLRETRNSIQLKTFVIKAMKLWSWAHRLLVHPSLHVSGRWREEGAAEKNLHRMMVKWRKIAEKNMKVCPAVVFAFENHLKWKSYSNNVGKSFFHIYDEQGCMGWAMDMDERWDERSLQKNTENFHIYLSSPFTFNFSLLTLLSPLALSFMAKRGTVGGEFRFIWKMNFLNSNEKTFWNTRGAAAASQFSFLMRNSSPSFRYTDTKKKYKVISVIIAAHMWEN